MKLKSYLIELTLVIIGVFIAITVDNIRENKKEFAQAESVLRIIKKDLQFDIDTLNTQLKSDSASLRQFSKLLVRLYANNYDSLDWYTSFLFYNSDYTLRATGYHTLINANLMMNIDLDLLEHITEYYETHFNNLKSWSRKDENFSITIILPALTANQDQFEKAVREKRFNVIELRRIVGARQFLLMQEMTQKRGLINKAKILVTKLSN